MKSCPLMSNPDFYVVVFIPFFPSRISCGAIKGWLQKGRTWPSKNPKGSASWRFGSADSARLFSTFLAVVFPEKKCQALFEAKMSQSVQQQSGWFIHVGLSRSDISKIRWVKMVLPEMLPSTPLQKDPKRISSPTNTNSVWLSSHSLPIPYNVFSIRLKRFHSSKVTTGTCPMRFVDFPRFQITLNFFQVFHLLSIFFPVKINPSSPAVLAPYLPPTLTNIPIKPLVLFDTWNPNDPCFEWKRPCFVGLTFKNRGHQRVPGIYIYIYTYVPDMHPLVSGIFPCLPPHGCLVEGVHLFGPRFLSGIEVLHGKVTAWLPRRDLRFPAGVFPEVLVFLKQENWVWHQTEKEGNQRKTVLKKTKKGHWLKHLFFHGGEDFHRKEELSQRFQPLQVSCHNFETGIPLSLGLSCNATAVLSRSSMSTLAPGKENLQIFGCSALQNNVDGTGNHQLIWRIYHYLQCFKHVRWWFGT